MQWSDLDWPEADALAKRIGERVPEAVDRLIRESPDGLALDHSRDSLRRLWQWAIDQPNRGGIAEADDPTMPLWYRYDAEFSKNYGIERSLVGLTNDVVSYLAFSVQRLHPSLYWTAHPPTIGRVPAATPNQPVLSDGERVFGTFTPFLGTVYRAVVAKDPAMRAPGLLQPPFDRMVAPPQPQQPSLSCRWRSCSTRSPASWGRAAGKPVSGPRLAL